jgi:hypothetical protein
VFIPIKQIRACCAVRRIHSLSLAGCGHRAHKYINEIYLSEWKFHCIQTERTDRETWHQCPPRTTCGSVVSECVCVYFLLRACLIMCVVRGCVLLDKKKVAWGWVSFCARRKKPEASHCARCVKSPNKSRRAWVRAQRAGGRRVEEALPEDHLLGHRNTKGSQH